MKLFFPQKRYSRLMNTFSQICTQKHDENGEKFLLYSTTSLYYTKLKNYQILRSVGCHM